MTDFVLRTKTERALYIEALLCCVEQGTVSEAQASQDIEKLCLPSGDLSPDARRFLTQRVSGILSAYRAQAIDANLAKSNIIDLINSVAPEWI